MLLEKNEMAILKTEKAMHEVKLSKKRNSQKLTDFLG